jgi:glycosyltransferase involved in cell wall biosynthesis
MADPLVSIVTPVINRRDTIQACLDSVASQSYPRIEHIVVDGGSTDGTLNAIRRHRTDHHFKWISEPDQGMYDAINKGLALSQGDIVAYLNSDDLYLPWSVDVAVQAIGAGADLIYGDLGVLKIGNQNRAVSFYVQFYPRFDLRFYAFVASIGQPTVFWRRSVMDRVGLFDTRYRLIGDCDYWLRAALRGMQPRHVPEVLAVQVEHSATLRATQPAKLIEEFARLRQAMAEVIDPPASLRWERLKLSIVWRARLLEFMSAMKTNTLRKWPYFVTRLRGHGVNVGWRDLRILAPARWRGDASLFADAPFIHEVLIGQEST